MNIEVEALGWNNKCCGCNNDIAPTEKTYILSEITGLSCSIHLCDSCINKISNSKQKEGD